MIRASAEQLDSTEASLPNETVGTPAWNTFVDPKRHGSDVSCTGRPTAIFAKSRLGESSDVPAGRPPEPADLCSLYLTWIGARQPSKDRIYVEAGPASTAPSRTDAYIRLLEDMEFGRIGLLVVPNLDHLLLGTWDPYLFYSWCRQLDIELHTVDRGPRPSSTSRCIDSWAAGS